MNENRGTTEATVRMGSKAPGCLLAAWTSALLCAVAAEAGDCADLALVLAIDGSGSIDTEEYVTQLDGYQTALSSSAVRRALAQAGRVAIGAVLWGDDAMPSTVFPLQSVDDPRALDALSEELRQAGWRTWGSTGIGAAVWLSLDLLAASDRRRLRTWGSPAALQAPECQIVVRHNEAHDRVFLDDDYPIKGADWRWPTSQAATRADPLAKI